MEKKINIIWIVIDGLRNYPTPCDPEKMGKPQLIDEIAKEGVEFTQATTSATSTVMSVTAMMTSIPAYYLSRNLEELRLERKYFESLGSILEHEGYSVYNVNTSYEMRRDYWREFLRPVDQKYWPKGCKAMMHWSNDPVNPIIFRLLDEGIKTPFLLYVHYNGRRDAEYVNKVADLIERFKKEGLYEDSVFVICSDHGMPDPERRDHYTWLKESGFLYNRHDLIMTDDNICIPLVFKYPGCPKSKKISVTVGTIDIMPTILDILRIRCAKDAKYGGSFRGVSLVRLIEGKDIEYYASRKIRTDARYISQRDRMISIRGTGYKYVFFRDIPSAEKEQFYDLSNDPFESKNLIDTKDPFYIEKIKEYRDEYNRQEKDAISFQKEFLSQRTKRNFKKHLKIPFNNRPFKILFLGSSNPSFFKLFYEIIAHLNNFIKVDILLERHNNILPNEEMVKIGFRNIILIPYEYNFKYFKKNLMYLMESYDICITPITDYKKDIEQFNSKSTESEMQMVQPPKPINNRIIRDYKEIFKIVKKIKADEKIYIDYNFNMVKNPRFFLISRYLVKMIAKRDIYQSKPFEILRDIKKILGS